MPPGIKRIIPTPWGVVLTLSLLLPGCGGKPAPMAGGAPPGVPVTLQKLEATILTNVSEYVGVLEANQIVTLKPEIDGRIRQIFVKEGDAVSVGTPILSLNGEKRQASLQSAIANVNAATATRNNAQAQLSAVEAERLEALANLQLQQEDMKRISSLVAEGALPKRDLDQIKRDLQVAEARLNTIDKRIKAFQATVNQTQASLKQTENEATFAAEELQDTKLVSPINGIVGDIEVKIGDFVELGDPLTVITESQTLSLNLFIPVEQSPLLRLGIPVEVINYKTKKTLAQGRISFISPEVDFNSQTLLAKASFPNQEGKLFTGQLVKAQIIWSKTQGISVPVKAISRIGGETFVFVAQKSENSLSEPPQMIAKQKPVKLGAIEGNNYQVLAGLEVGEMLITTGILNLMDGTPIMTQSPE